MQFRYSLLAFIFFSITVWVNSAEPSNAANNKKYGKPNIIMIVVDDLGWSDVGYNQTSSYFETPNVDVLAQQGLVFDQAYAGATNCAPSRAVLMSGQYGPRHGVYTVSPSTRGDAKTRKLIPIKNKRGISTDVITIAESLKTVGYTTGSFGKWHLGFGNGQNLWDKPLRPGPQDLGFSLLLADRHRLESLFVIVERHLVGVAFFLGQVVAVEP